MADQSWLFPEKAEIAIRDHDAFFQNMPKPGRRLTFRELQSHGEFPVGWRTGSEISGKWIGLDILLDANIPYSAPRIALPDDNHHLVWPHIEKNGLLCLRTSADMVDHNAGVGLTAYYIEEAQKLVEDSMEGKTAEDFATEFRSYWARWRTVRGSRLSPIWLLSKAIPPSRKVYSGSFGGVNIICDSVEEGLQWTKAYFKGEKIKEDEFRPAMLIWMAHALMPGRYPKHNSHIADLAREAGCFDLMVSIVPDKPDNMQVVFGFDTPNGAALGALKLNEPIASKAYKSKPVYSRFKGNRPAIAKTHEMKKRYFSTEGRAEPMEVQRIDREWIFTRGGKGLEPKLDQARVCVIGCGSLGAQVARYIVQSGIRKLVLIDPEKLSWDNIGRHLLGADAIEKKKTTCLKEYLEIQFPDMLEIDEMPSEWQAIFSDPTKKDLIIKSDIVISTLGDWDAEAALNYAFISGVEFPPIVFGWTEPFGVAGHALSVTGLGGCLLCGMSPKGAFKYAFSKWPEKNHLRRIPACGETYQPYGAIDIAPIQAMIAKLAVDVLLGNSKNSTHRAYIGSIEDIQVSGGTVWDGATEYYGRFGHGYCQIENEWRINSSCSYRH